MAEKHGGFIASLTSATTTDWVRARRASIEIYGSFVGTVEIQVQNANGDWRAIDDGTFTDTGTGGVKTVDLGVEMPLRVECTAYTSGTINVACTADRRAIS